MNNESTGSVLIPTSGSSISTVSPTLDHASAPQPKLSDARRYMLFCIFCIANMLDAYNLNALFTGLPVLKSVFGLDEVDASWVMSAFELTYASFLLVSGRISDVYNPEPAFVSGLFGLGALSLGAGFVQNKIGLIIIRAVCGICAALSIPSSLAMIVRIFPEPHKQSLAIALFGGVAALSNVFGTMLSAVFIDFASYRWIFFFTAIIGIPSALLCIIIIPKQDEQAEPTDQVKSRWEGVRRLDLIGVTILTVALILFIFAITSGSGAGWGSAGVIAPLIIAIVMIISFFLWEARVPVENAAVPPCMWFMPNFSVLFAVSLQPYFWWTTVFVVFFPLWQQVYQWDAINSGLRMIPIGIAATAISFTSPLGRYVSRKVLILTGQTMVIAATVLLAHGDAPDKYWRIVFPGLVIGSAGSMLTYMHVSIAIFQSAPRTMAGVIGAMFNSALQLGAALGLAIDTSIETSVEARTGGFADFAGRRAVMWWLLAAVCAETVAVVAFYHVRPDSSSGEAVEEKRQSSVEV